LTRLQLEAEQNTAKPFVGVTPRRKLSRLRVVVLSESATRGVLQAGSVAIPCVLGRSGLLRRKREGDGATPIGAFLLSNGLWRAERSPRPLWTRPLRPISRAFGWCDDPTDANYNRPIRLPFRSSCETLQRADRLYDILIVLDYNIAPRRRSAGSGIFLHVATNDFAPTQGCVAVKATDLRRLLPRLAPRARLKIG
jgi:L,D-peptidoglycan transpeptidase YkuD (ErfK/YbiS/YcfS/YnhG family)